MPASSVVLSATPLTGDTIAAAAARVWAEHGGPDATPYRLQTVDGGAVLQIIVGDAPVLSVLRPRALTDLDEVARLLPETDAPADAAWWTDAVTPFTPLRLIGHAVLDVAAAASGGIAVHLDRL